MILILMRKFRAHTDMIQLGIYPGLQKKVRTIQDLICAHRFDSSAHIGLG